MIVDADVRLTGSKSITNRALICAALADGRSRLRGALRADDTEAMVDCVTALGATVTEDWQVDGTGGRLRPGPVTVDDDDPQQITERVMEMLDALLDRNGLVHDDLISILFTATDDIHSMFPALPARKAGFGDIPLICARELDIVGGTPRCIRVLVHITTDRARDELRHVYLHGARGLNDDLPT